MKLYFSHVKDTWARMISRLLMPDFPDVKPMPELHEAIEQARHEWICTQRYYNSVSDQDLVDLAVYMMLVSEKKYIYLLKQARKAGITYSPYDSYHQ